MTEEQRREFERGIAAFNRGEYFEAHEIWESVWIASNGPQREFLQGLIQVSVALHHLSRGNPSGARSLMERAEVHLADLPSPYYGIDCRVLLDLAGRCVMLGTEMIRSRTPAAKRCLTRQEWLALPLPKLEIQPCPD